MALPPARLSAIQRFHVLGDILRIPGKMTPPDLPFVIQRLAHYLGSEIEPVKSWLADPSQSLAPASPHNQPRWWSDHIHSALKDSLLGHSSGRDVTRLASQSNGEGACWMTVVPSAARCTLISPAIYRLAVCWWLGLPVGSNLVCPACHCAIDAEGDHLLCCHHNNFYARHAALVSTAENIFARAHLQVEVEVPLDRWISREPLRPADLLVHHWEDGKPLAIDFTVSHAAQRSEAPFSMAKARSFTKRLEEAKQKKYSEPCGKQGWAFTGAGMDAWGRQGLDCRSLLTKLMQKVSRTMPMWDRPRAIREMRETLNLAVMRQVWKCLASGSVLT